MNDRLSLALAHCRVIKCKDDLKEARKREIPLIKRKMREARVEITKLNHRINSARSI